MINAMRKIKQDRGMTYQRKWGRRIRSLRECLEKISQRSHLSDDLEEAREGTTQIS